MLKYFPISLASNVFSDIFDGYQKEKCDYFEKTNTSQSGTPVDVTTNATPELDIELVNDSSRLIAFF